jgi:hypothetical protein
MKFGFVFWDVLLCKIIVDRRLRGTCCLHHQGDEIALMKEVARTSETSVDNYFTRQYIQEDKSELQEHFTLRIKRTSKCILWVKAESLTVKQAIHRIALTRSFEKQPNSSS